MSFCGMPENRVSRRQRALKSAKISYGNGQFEVDCIIRNFSDTGVQLKVPTTVPIPDHFDLVEAGKRRRVTVAWRKGEFIGVKYDS
jgi:hypothetical protein